MKVEVKYYALLREAVGRKIEAVELPAKSSVGDLLGLLVDRHGGDFRRYVYDEEKKVRHYLSYMLNGINVYSLDGFDTPLKNGDVLAILPPVGGG